jgi:hypothetical protein
MNQEVTNGVILDHLAQARWSGNYRRNPAPNRIWVDSTHLIYEESDQRRIGMSLKITLNPPGVSSATVWHEFIGKSLPSSQWKRPFGTSSMTFVARSFWRTISLKKRSQELLHDCVLLNFPSTNED